MSNERESLQHGRIIQLTTLDDAHKSTQFIINGLISSGGSVMVYSASYSDGIRNYNCVLKELMPSGCGITRTGDHLNISDIEPKYQDKYERVRQRFVESYDIQLSFYNDTENKLLNLATSTPLAMYTDGNTEALYTVFTCDNIIDFLNYEKDHKLSDVLTIILQTAMVMKEYHNKGYLYIDIKEQNIGIAGSEDYPVVIMFDFGSLIPVSYLENYTYSQGMPLLQFSPHEDNIVLPPELVGLSNKLRKIKPTNANPSVLKSIEDKLHLYAKNGKSSDLYILVTIMFRRIFGYPFKSTLLINNIDMNKTRVFIPESCREFLTEILEKSLCEMVSKRLQSMDELIDMIKELLKLAKLEENKETYTKHGHTIDYTNITLKSLMAASREHFQKVNSNKFEKLKRLTKIYDSRIMLMNTEGQLESPIDVLGRNNNTFLYGDGGMGKSTALYMYWKQCVNCDGIVCFYIELNKYYRIEDKSGKSYSDFILRYIIKNIFLKDDETEYDKLDADDFKKMRAACEGQFEKSSVSPGYLLMLDGYNEMSQKERSAFSVELKHILDKWKNVRIVLSSRSFPNKEGYDGALYDILQNEEYHFFPFTFVGISEEEREHELITNGYSNNDIEKLKSKKTKLWDILKIPMFFNMYLSLDIDACGEVQTRGEILHAFISQAESNTANNISLAIVQDKTLAEYRRFVVTYAIPFVAIQMDRERVFTLRSPEVKKRLKDGFALFIEDDVIYDCFTENQSINTFFNGSKIVFKDDTLSLLIGETGYCVKTDDNQIEFVHQYFRDYFAALYIVNLLSAVQITQFSNTEAENRDKQLQFILEHGINYIWSNDVCELLGEITGDYKNAPENTISSNIS